MSRKFSVWSSYYIDLSPREMVLELERCGVRYSELSDEHGRALLEEGEDETSTGRAFRSFAEEHGVRFPQGHLWLWIRLCSGGAETLSLLKRWINLFEACGVERMVLHTDGIAGHPEYGEKERMDANIAVLRELIPFLQGKKIVICLENLIGYAKSADILMYALEQLKDPHFGICLDTGHLNLTERDQRGFILRCGKELKALHIADNEGETDQHIMPCGRGTVDFPDVFAALDKVGYDGLYNYEIPGERNCSLEIRALKLGYMRSVFEILSGQKQGQKAKQN